MAKFILILPIALLALSFINRQTDRTMNTQHSPGPWTEWQSGIFDVDGNIIATVSQDGQWNWIEGSNVECAPGEANARLIAAAPELLDVLQRMTPKFMQYTDEDQGLYLEAKALIAKLPTNENTKEK